MSARAIAAMAAIATFTLAAAPAFAEHARQGVVVSATASAQTGVSERPDIGGPRPVVARLPGGGTAIVRPEQGAPVAAVELWYRAPSIGFGSKAQPGVARLAAQAVAASKPIVGSSLADEVTAAGGVLQITSYSDSLEVAALVPASATGATVAAMTTAYFAPVLDPLGFARAQREVAQAALFASVDVGSFVHDAIFAQLFRDGPQHYPALGTPKTLVALTFSDIQSFAERAFRSSNAILVLSGQVASDALDRAAGGRGGPNREPEPPLTGALSASRAPLSQPSAEPSGGFGWLGPPISDERAATAMDFIADYLFGPDGIVTDQISRRYPKSVVLGQFITLHDPGVMFVAYGGDDGTEVQSLISRAVTAMTQPLTASAFAVARDAFEFHLLRDLQTPVQLADNFGWYTVEGNGAYAPGADFNGGAYFTAADSLTPAFVSTVAHDYLSRTPALVTFTGTDGKAGIP